MSCPDGYVPIKIALPPGYVCIPAPKEERVTKKCFTVYAPVVAITNTQVPLIYQVVAFAFDIYNTPVKIPLTVVQPNKKSNQVVDATVPSFLKAFEGLLIKNVKRSLGATPVKAVEIRSVFEPVCETSYVLVRVVGTIGERAVITPVVISPSYDQLTIYLASTVLGNIHRPTKATSYTILQVPVQFFMTPEQVTAFVNTSLGV